MSAQLEEQRDNRGLKPGMRHEGQFKAGREHRLARVLPNGETIASLARRYTPEVIELFAAAVRDESAKLGDRLAAGKYLMDRAWGQPASMVHMEVGMNRDPRSMSTAALEALVAGEAPHLPVIEGESVEVESTVLSAVPAGAERVS